jgi:DNA (cytosine-5)-methyltransferase 1
LSAKKFTSIELCAGCGGQALGLERAGFSHLALVEFEKNQCLTLEANASHPDVDIDWNVMHQDMRDFDPSPYVGVDLVAGGVPCQPFSAAGHKNGAGDERDMFPRALEIVGEVNPKAVVLENVENIFSRGFADYRLSVAKRLEDMGYKVRWQIISCDDFGTPQRRQRAILVALKPEYFESFSFPHPTVEQAPTFRDTVIDIMRSGGWEGADKWYELSAPRPAYTVIGGSKKAGGARLESGLRSRADWRDTFRIDARSIGNEPPQSGDPVDLLPKVTVPMLARVQGFPDDWKFVGSKTSTFRQVGNAFPPQASQAIGEAVARALNGEGPDPRGHGPGRVCYDSDLLVPDSAGEDPVKRNVAETMPLFSADFDVALARG